MDRQGFANRLRHFITSRYGSVYAFAHETVPGMGRRSQTRSRRPRFPYPTVKNWTRRRQPRCPIEESLVHFAQLTGVSLDWLVMGSGDELRGVSGSVPELGTHLRRKIEAELRAAGFKSPEIQRV